MLRNVRPAYFPIEVIAYVNSSSLYANIFCCIVWLIWVCSMHRLRYGGVENFHTNFIDRLIRIRKKSQQQSQCMIYDHDFSGGPIWKLNM